MDGNKSLKRSKDRRRLKQLSKWAASGVLTRALIYMLPFHISGLIVEIFWLPLIFWMLAWPFYKIETFLDNIKESKEH